MTQISINYPDYYYMDLNGVILHQREDKDAIINKYILDIPSIGACTMIRTSILKRLEVIQIIY